ncbi:MAG: DUF11 domain-containing protein [Draconibacterium sp.]|nr:DUF11 domain-containing protein [Draconibacterium sp.]
MLANHGFIRSATQLHRLTWMQVLNLQILSVVSDQVPGPTVASALTPLSASASLTVDKVRSNGTDPVTAAGEVIDYTVTVQNTGGLTITGVAASDLLPDGSAGTLSAPAESISANGELNVGESWIYTISYTVTG